MSRAYRTERESGRHNSPFWEAPDIAKAGYPVFPLAPKGKNPSVPGGFYAATTDLSQIAAWIEEGRANHDVAIATGIVSGVVVVEADTPEAYARMETAYGPPHVNTRRGGHWYFRHPRDGKVVSTSISSGLDRKADGGYVAVPPSSGKSWTNDIPVKDELVVLPPELRGTEEQRDQRPGAGPRQAEDLGEEEIPNGSRNKALTSIGGLLRRRGLDEAAIRAALLGINAAKCKPPLPEAEVEKISRSVARYEPSSNGGSGAVLANTTHPHDRDAGSFNMTDLGNAERLVAAHGEDLRYIHPWRRWLVWDGTRWAVDAAGEVERRAVETVRAIYAEAERAEDADERKRIARHATTSESRARIEAMIALARSMSGIPALPETLDADPWLLNVKNGTLDLHTGELREHRREDLITRLSPVEYYPEARAPRFERFLREVLVEEDVVAFVRRFAGYSLTGSTRERVFAILWGSGKNGKSTLVELLRDVLGNYATNTDMETVLVRKYSGVGNDVAALKGARFVSAAEVEQGHALAESKVKNLTGSDTVTARFLFAELFDFRPEFKLWLSTNNKPIIRGTDDAIWDRIRLIPFTQRFEGRDADPELPDKLRTELPGVLAWMVRGCLEWQRGGLGAPDKVVAATEGYRAEMDVLAAFIEERCIVRPDVWCKFSDLYAAYTSWCEESNERPEKKRRFADRLTERGFEKANGTDNVAIRRGIALRFDGGPDPSRINDPDPAPDSEHHNSPPEVGEFANSSNDGGKFVNSQNPCKSGSSDVRINEDYRESKPIDRNPPREGSCQKTINDRYFINPGPSAPRRDGQGPDAVAAIIEDPPEWLVEQLGLLRRNPELIHPTCSAISYEVYGTAARWGEVQPIIEAHLKGGAPAA